MYKYNISVISDICGIKPHTLRMWEKRYTAFEPLRDDRGVRLYSDKDLHKANLLGFLTKRGFSISEIVNHELEHLKAIKLKVSGFSALEKKFTSQDHLVNLIQNYQFSELMTELREFKTKLGTRDFVFEVVLPLVRFVGEKVYSGELNITQDRMLSVQIKSEIIKTEFSSLMKKDVKILLATPLGNYHELPILIADLICRYYGASTFLMGASHPGYQLSESINILKPNVVVIGVRDSAAWVYEKELIPFLEQMDFGLEHNVKVIIGGGPLIKLPEFNHIESVIFMSKYEELEDLMEGL